MTESIVRYLFFIVVFPPLECKFDTCIENTHLRIGLIAFVSRLRVDVLKARYGQKVVSSEIDPEALDSYLRAEYRLRDGIA